VVEGYKVYVKSDEFDIFESSSKIKEYKQQLGFGKTEFQISAVLQVAGGIQETPKSETIILIRVDDAPTNVKVA
jgi:hypothetical protein